MDVLRYFSEGHTSLGICLKSLRAGTNEDAEK